MESLVLFSTLLLKLTEEATLAVGEDIFDNRIGTSLLSRTLACTLPTMESSVKNYDEGVAKILWQLALLPAADKKIVKLVMERQTPMLPDFWSDAVNSCCFATLELFNGFSQLFKGGWLIELLFE